MPRMDGYEVAAHVRNDPRLKHIPIVMITSRVSEKHRARAIELGVDDYLGKAVSRKPAARCDRTAGQSAQRRRALGNSKGCPNCAKSSTACWCRWRRAADRAARLRRRGHRLSDARRNDQRAALVRGSRELGRAQRAGRVVRRGIRQPRCRVISSRTRIVIFHAAGRQDAVRLFRHADPRISAARARQRRCRSARSVAQFCGAIAGASAKCAWSTRRR